jgi:hypothetical protein
VVRHFQDTRALNVFLELFTYLNSREFNLGNLAPDVLDCTYGAYWMTGWLGSCSLQCYSVVDCVWMTTRPNRLLKLALPAVQWVPLVLRGSEAIEMPRSKNSWSCIYTPRVVRIHVFYMVLMSETRVSFLWGVKRTYVTALTFQLFYGWARLVSGDGPSWKRDL